MGIDDRKLAKNITEGDMNMEDIVKKVENFSDDEEILGAYDGEWHRQEVARVVMMDKLEKAEEQGIEQGIETTARNMLKEDIDIERANKDTKQLTFNILRYFMLFFTDFSILSSIYRL